VIRERREELTNTIAFVGSSQQTLKDGVPRDLPLTRLLLAHEGRLVLASQTVAGNYLPEYLAAMIRNVILQGTKVTGGGSITLINCRGEELHRLMRFVEIYIPIGNDLQNLPGVGGTTPAAPLAATANGTFDYRVYYEIPIAPRFVNVRDEIQGILDPSIFSQLDLKLQFGNNDGGTSAANLTNIATGFTSTTGKFTAFGSAGGTPQVRVMRFSPLAQGLPINKYHYTHLSKQVNMNSIAAAANDTKITDLNAGNKLVRVQLRQYSELAGVPGQIDQLAGASLARIGDNSNPGIFRVRVKVNGSEKLRSVWPDLQEHNRQVFNMTTVMPQGYALTDFCDRANMDSIWDARGFGAAAVRFELFGDWTGITATDRLDILQVEQVPVEV
jgi:hypothetical protein